LKLVSVCIDQVFIPLNRAGGFTFSSVNPWFSKASLGSRTEVVERMPGADIKFLLRTRTNVTSNHRNIPWEFFTECAKILKCNSSGNLRPKTIVLFNFFSIFFLKNDLYLLHANRVDLSASSKRTNSCFFCSLANKCLVKIHAATFAKKYRQ